MPSNPTLPLIEHLDLITSVDLGHVAAPGENDIYHFIYASTLYGTLFGIYGKFDAVRGPANTLVRSIKMRILNYHGVLNIGFERNPDYDVVDHIVDFWVQGASGNDEADVQLNQSIPNGTRFKLQLNRTVMPLAGFSESTDTTTRLSTPSQKDALFDTEFHYRDGIANYHQLRRDGMAVPHRSSLVGHRCITSVIYLRA